MTPTEMLQQGRRLTDLEEEVARLRAQNAELMAALRPVAERAIGCEEWRDDQICGHLLTMREIRKAQDAIRRAEEGLAHE